MLLVLLLTASLLTAPLRTGSLLTIQLLLPLLHPSLATPSLATAHCFVQELIQRVFTEFMRPVLMSCGIEGCFGLPESGYTQELAIFWRSSKFRCVVPLLWACGASLVWIWCLSCGRDASLVWIWCLSCGRVVPLLWVLLMLWLCATSRTKFNVIKRAERSVGGGEPVRGRRVGSEGKAVIGRQAVRGRKAAGARQEESQSHSPSLRVTN